MVEVFNYLSWIVLGLGTLFCLIGAIGTVRMPDVYTRMHAASLIETMGAGSILLGLGLQSGFGLVSVKLFIIFAFLMFTNPTTTHALARALHHAGVMPVVAKPSEQPGMSADREIAEQDTTEASSSTR